MGDLRRFVAVLGTDRTSLTGKAAVGAGGCGQQTIVGAFFQREYAAGQCRRRASGNTGWGRAVRAGMRAVDPLGRAKIAGGQQHGTVSRPTAERLVDAKHERGWLMPASALAQALQADERRAGINEAIAVRWQNAPKNAVNRGNAVVVNRMFAGKSRRLDACP